MSVNSFYENLGRKLKAYRKAGNFTLLEVSKALNKSLPTVSKYEKGEIAIPLDVLVDLCSFFNLDISLLLPSTHVAKEHSQAERYRQNFIDRLYLYWYKGEDNKIHVSAIENDNSTLRSTFFFDIKEPADIYACSFIYTGSVTYSDTITNFEFKNTLPPYDILTFSVPTCAKEQEYKIGLLSTITFYYQNVAIKCYAAKEPVAEPRRLLDKLQLSAEELRRIRSSNFFIV